jgi:Zn-dependent protease with chaperone function
VRFDTANRSFAGLSAISIVLGMLVLCGAAGCVLLALLVSQLAQDGSGALTSDGHDLWPAVAFITIVGVGMALGIWSVRGQVKASRKLSRRVRDLELPLTAELGEAADRAGLSGRVELVDSGECFSFAYGALTPRVAVSRRLLEDASASELDAVLEHERYHVRNLDPLKVLLARALPATFFYLPALRALHTRYVAGRELAADRRAVQSCGRKPLAGALYKVVRGPGWAELGAAAAIGGPELLDVRVAQLESGSEPRIAALTARALLLSLLGATLLTALFVASIVSFGGPSAVARATGSSLTPLDVAGGLLCAVPWAAGGWLGYRWLSRRTRHGLDQTTGLREPGRLGRR